MHEISPGHRSLSGTIPYVSDRIRFLPVTMTSGFSNFNNISYTDDQHESRVTGTKCWLPDTMSGNRHFVPVTRTLCRSCAYNIPLKFENLPVIVTGRKRILSVTHEIVPDSDRLPAVISCTAQTPSSVIWCALPYRSFMWNFSLIPYRSFKQRWKKYKKRINHA